MSERLTDFRQLNVWQKAHKLVLDIYEITRKFPKDERGELVSRMRQASMCIPIKIAEGFMRRSPREKAAAYKDSQQALEEIKYYTILIQDLGYAKNADDLLESVEEVGRMLTGLVRSVKNDR